MARASESRPDPDRVPPDGSRPAPDAGRGAGDDSSGGVPARGPSGSASPGVPSGSFPPEVPAAPVPPEVGAGSVPVNEPAGSGLLDGPAGSVPLNGPDRSAPPEGPGSVLSDGPAGSGLPGVSAASVPRNAPPEGPPGPVPPGASAYGDGIVHDLGPVNGNPAALRWPPHPAPHAAPGWPNPPTGPALPVGGQPPPGWPGPAGQPAYPHPDQPPPNPAGAGRRHGLLPRPPPVPPRTHRWGLGAYLLVELVFLLASAAVGVLVVGDGPPRAWALAVALAVPTMIAAGLALLITVVRGNGPRVDLRLSWSWADVRLGLAYGLGGLFVTLPASVLYMSIVGPDATSAVGEVFGDVRTSWPLALVIFAAVVFIAPLCEEIVYRGLLWGAVERHVPRPWVAMVVTTLLFALAHFEFTRTPLLLVVSIPIALARLFTGRLLASIVAHQVNNLLPGIALMLGLIGAIPMT